MLSTSAIRDVNIPESKENRVVKVDYRHKETYLCSGCKNPYKRPIWFCPICKKVYCHKCAGDHHLQMGHALQSVMRVKGGIR